MDKNPTVSGAANDWPFLYHGIEHEFTEPNQYYYSGNGAFYSAQIMRSLSLTSAQGTAGPGGGPGPDSAHHHHGGGGAGGESHGAAINGHVNAAAMMAQDDLNGDEPNPPDPEVQAESLNSLGNLLASLLDQLFYDLRIGQPPSVSLPLNYFLFQQRLMDHIHPLYRDIIAVQDLPNQAPITGQASAYAKSFNGRQTASGEIFDSNKFTAAMVGVPMGTEVTVAYKTKKVNVIVNDTGPWAMDANGKPLRPLQPHPTRVIDLSPAAMKALTGNEQDLIDVRITIPAERPEPLP